MRPPAAQDLRQSRFWADLKGKRLWKFVWLGTENRCFGTATSRIPCSPAAKSRTRSSRTTTPASRPPKTSLEAAKDAAIAFCSGLRRTVETAAALGVRCRLIEDPLFAEPVVPYGFWKKTKLPLALWFAISQTVWSLGYSLNSEPVARARARAEKAAALLINAAKQNGTVLLVGHSVMNSMIFQALQRRKWKAVRPFDGKFWGCNVLVKI